MESILVERGIVTLFLYIYILFYITKIVMFTILFWMRQESVNTFIALFPHCIYKIMYYYEFAALIVAMSRAS